MLSKLLTVIAVATLAAAIPTGSVSQCNTGPIQCCNQVDNADSGSVADMLKIFGIVVQDANALVGVGCTPITLVGLGFGGKCEADAVCCEDNQFNGLVSIGCTHVKP